MHAFAPI